MTWEDLARLVDIYPSESRSPFKELQKPREAKQLETVGSEIHDEDGKLTKLTAHGGTKVFNLCHANEAFADRECKDRHDRIYALLGLASDYRPQEDTKLFAVDYAVSLEELFLRVLYFCGPQVPPGFIHRLLRALGLSDTHLRYVPRHVVDNDLFNAHIPLHSRQNKFVRLLGQRPLGGKLNWDMPMSEPGVLYANQDGKPLFELHRYCTTINLVFDVSTFKGFEQLSSLTFNSFFLLGEDATLRRKDTSSGPLELEAFELYPRTAIACVSVLLKLDTVGRGKPPQPLVGLFADYSLFADNALYHMEHGRQKLASQLQDATWELSSDNKTLQLSLPAKHWITWFGPDRWIMSSYQEYWSASSLLSDSPF